MNEVRHTPGPWKAVTTDAFGSITIAANGRSICDIIGTMPVDEANARLIAAALDMAEALKWCILLHESTLSGIATRGEAKSIIDDAIAALKKAGVK